MLSTFGLCGDETANAYLAVVQDVATMDRPSNYEHMDHTETTPYNALTLNLHGMPFDFDALRVIDPPPCCPTRNAALLSDSLILEPLHTRMHTWQSHLGRCDGDGSYKPTKW